MFDARWPLLELHRISEQAARTTLMLLACHTTYTVCVRSSMPCCLVLERTWSWSVRRRVDGTWDGMRFGSVSPLTRSRHDEDGLPVAHIPSYDQSVTFVDTCSLCCVCPPLPHVASRRVLRTNRYHCERPLLSAGDSNRGPIRAGGQSTLPSPCDARACHRRFHTIGCDAQCLLLLARSGCSCASTHRSAPSQRPSLLRA
jgi:hypothetical protein